MQVGLLSRLMLSSRDAVDFLAVASACAEAELRAQRETILKMLGVLREAVENGVGIEAVMTTLEEWLAEIEELERALLEESRPRLRLHASAAAGV